LAPGPVAVHFRGEAARLGAVGADWPADHLVLTGRITQASYPGGHWRYAVAVGDRQFMVDDPARRAVGDAVGIGLAADAIHLFPAHAT
jgi:ABC-type Fe3+/spermidine/putrescine transport system ATPase subunit